MYQLLNKGLGLAVLFCGAVLSAQTTVYEFKKLVAIDTISDAEYQRVMGSPDVKSNTFLISKWNVNNGKDQLALFKKTGQNWTVFSIFEQQTTGEVKLSENEQFLTYVTSAKVEAEDYTHAKTYLCIIDLFNDMQLPILQQTNNQSWPEKNNKKNIEMIETGCRSQIVLFGKGRVSSVYTASRDFSASKKKEGNCLPGGQYVIKDNKLVMFD